MNKGNLFHTLRFRSFCFCGMMDKGGRLQIRLPEAVARGSTDEPK